MVNCNYSIVIAFLLSSSFSAILSAADPTLSPSETYLIRNKQERLLQDQQKRLDELQQLPNSSTTTKPELTDEPRCFKINDIKLQGAQHISASKQTALLKPFMGKCLGAQGLDALLKTITAYYLNRGYITSRAYLPEQDLNSGTLQIIVVEGSLQGFEPSALVSEREWQMTFPGKSGGLLNLRELEQQTEQLSRLPSRSAQLQLVPGDNMGNSRVTFSGSRDKPWRISANRHNNGERSTGEQQWGARLEWDSPLGLADQLLLHGGGDTVSDRFKHSANQGISYSIPYGWWTFNYGYNQSYYRTRNELAGGFKFELDGESKIHQLQAERVLYRGTSSKTAANMGLSKLETRNYIENTLIKSSSQRLTELQVGFNHGARIGSSYLNLDLGYQKGIGTLDAQNNHHPKGSEPVARYKKYSLTASFLNPFKLYEERFSFDSLLYYQKSEDVLFSPQRISLGGISSVRGFKEQSLSGDSGGYWRNQLRWTKPISTNWLQPFIQQYGLTLAYDQGIIKKDKHNGDYHGKLSGNAIELNLRGAYFTASLSAAHSLKRPQVLEDRERPLYFRVEVFY